jgi:hypothetical protein
MSVGPHERATSTSQEAALWSTLVKSLSRAGGIAEFCDNGITHQGTISHRLLQQIKLDSQWMLLSPSSEANMTLKVQDYVGRPRDSKAETELANALRKLDPDEAFAFVWEYAGYDPVVALELANRVLRDRNQFERMLHRGFEEADASSIRFWLECCVPRVGPTRTMKLLRDIASKDIDAGRRIFYRTRLVLLKEDSSLEGELDALAARLKIGAPPVDG